ncbi:Aste57867_9306 [Aphanomyces stellatus]|uniref:Aste57867_9306 protein n=1 Tax=Aphanomyces stellatus TaxID=120398 RepID=A0A485KMJ6_9STRA|nr:hypothetical protein As57867_009270 [Aphanomyces stellatus]VFT86188.1 Aste57867_9306 [Aphanomyces stellatus]
MPRTVVLLCILALASTTPSLSSATNAPDDSPIQNYLDARANDSLLCLYTFDTPDVTSIVPGCPFGTLRFPSASHVVPLGDDRVGYRWSPTDDVSTVHAVGSDVVSARTFYESSLSRRGVSFELVLRLYGANSAVNLFAIASPYDDCAHPGFRLEVSARGLLVLVFYVLKPDNGVLVCFEQHFYSMVDGGSSTAPCVVPRGSTRNATTPLVHVLVSVAPRDPTPYEWTTVFSITYHDTNDNTRHDCMAYNAMGGAPSAVDVDAVGGAYRLYVGNNGRGASYRATIQPKPPRPPLPPLPEPTTSTSFTLFQDAADTLSLVLPQPGGFFWSVNGQPIIDWDDQGVSFGAKGRKWTLAAIQSKIASVFAALKTSSGLVGRQDAVVASFNLRGSTTAAPPPPRIDWARAPPHVRYPAPNASVDMDLFLFGIGTTTLSVDRVRAIPAIELPHMGMPTMTRTVTMDQDTSVRLLLRAFLGPRRRMHGVRVTQWPAYGTLSRCHSIDVVVTNETLLDDLCVMYTPPRGASNDRIPTANPYLAARRATTPFVTLGYGPVEASLGATTTAAALVHVFVTPSTTTRPFKATRMVVGLEPPFQYTTTTPEFRLTLSLHVLPLLDPTRTFRMTLKANGTAQLTTTTSPLAKPTRGDYCPPPWPLSQVCLARDGAGVTYELSGLATSLPSSQVVLRGTVAQLQHALTNLSVVVRPATTTTVVRLRLHVQAIDEDAPSLFRQSIDVVFDLSRRVDACSPLLGVLPFVCQETFGGAAGVGGSLATALVLVVVVSAWQRQTVARRRADGLVHTAVECNAIVHQLKRVFQEPNLDAATTLLRVCDTAHDRHVARAALALVVGDTMVRVVACLIADATDTDATDETVRFHCRFVGRAWLNGVLDAAAADGGTRGAFLAAATAHLAALPLDIALLSTLGSSPTFGFVDHFLVPCLREVAEMPSVDALETLVDAVRRRAATESFVPVRRDHVDAAQLLPHALAHLVALCTKYKHRIRARACATHEDGPPVGVRLEQLVDALDGTPFVVHHKQLLGATIDVPPLRY